MCSRHALLSAMTFLSSLCERRTSVPSVHMDCCATLRWALSLYGVISCWCYDFAMLIIGGDSPPEFTNSSSDNVSFAMHSVLCIVFFGISMLG